MRRIAITALASLILATSVQAATITPLASNAPLPGNSVTFTNGEVGTTLFGDANGLTDIVRVDSGEDVMAFSFARNGFLAADNSGLDFFSFSLADTSLGFDLLRFQFRAFGAATGGPVTITAFDKFGSTLGMIMTALTVNKGLNRFVVDADAGEVISRVTVTGAFPNSFTDVSEFGIGNIQSVAAVPGPIAGAGLPALLALGGFVWARRRKAAAAA